MKKNEDGSQPIDNGSGSGWKKKRIVHPNWRDMKFDRILRWLVFLIFCVSIFGPLSNARAQSPSQTTTPEILLASMTPEERVGQLFLVTFQGVETTPEAQIYDLIANRHVGGVVLLAANDNFAAAPDTIINAGQLIRDLQTTEWEAANAKDENGKSFQYVPLFVGISQEGDREPHDQILDGLTPLPSAMAIGAAWDTTLSRQVGFVAGSELSALGFNLFLGPSLDVVDAPNPEALSDLGTRVFGGDPFWVGEMGRAYVAGLHEGSNNRMVVVAKHFPGRGSSDRLPEAEVATVRKSLEQLKQIELPPFFTVTNSADAAGVVDGLLVSHIRYLGFQGNIRATTRPVSFDASALPEILSLPEFTAWRTNGGLVVSDSLGSEAVREFYSQQGAENFSPSVVARDAFFAGNDLLYLGNIRSDSAEGDSYSAALEILDFFAQEYRKDPVFAERVDAAVLRILTRKSGVYGSFNIANVHGPAVSPANVGVSQQVMFDIARNSATLISPDPQELSTLLPEPPGRGDRIVFLTDTSTYQQCTACPVQGGFAVDALQKDVVRLYGQSGSAQILTNRLASFSFAELEAMLNDTSETNIEDSLTRATWIVISLTDVNENQLVLLRRFFSERPNLVRNRNVILFSFTAPYYLDATDISKLTAYYALYSKQPAFVDVAARLLFQQVSLQGASPVSLPAIGYDLIIETSPDPAQVIPLSLDQELLPELTDGTLTPEPTQTPSYRIGDTIVVRAGPILDRNGHVVPDGTVARFTMSTRDESGGILYQEEATAIAGLARASFSIDKPGSVEITVVSEPALVSVKLQFTASNEGVVVTEVVPVVTATPTIMPPTPAPVDTPRWVTEDGYPRVGGWFLSLLALAGSTGLIFWAMSRIVSFRWGIRWGLCVFIGGLIGYNYLALGFPGVANWIMDTAGSGGLLVLTFTGETLGAIATFIWMKWFSGPESRAG